MTIRVLGLGNVLMGDDGFGPAVVHRLESDWRFDDAVEVQDLGTPGLDLVPFLSGADVVILVDTVKSDGEPGDIRRYDKAQVLAHPPHPRVSPHDPGVKDTLLALEFSGTGPREVVLVGAIPASVSMTTRLSEPLERAVPVVAQVVVDELRGRGVRVWRRDAPATGKAWWQE
jgi:hydrogenase maturation protease